MSCHWTTPQGRLKDRSWLAGLGATSSGPACKYSCTLSGGARRTGRHRSALLAAVALACALAAGVQSAVGASSVPSTTCRGAELRPNARNLAAVDSATLCLIDRSRAAHHLEKPKPNGALRAVAGSQVASMVRGDYFADIRPSGQTPHSLIAGSRYPARTSLSTGQILAWGTDAEATPASIVAAWMASPPHRRIILKGEYSDVGVAAIGRLLDLRCERGAHALVSVDGQHPVAARLRQRKIFLRPKAGKVMGDHTRTVSPRDLRRIVAAATVNYDAFIGKSHAGETVRDIGCLVLGDDDCTQARHECLCIASGSGKGQWLRCPAARRFLKGWRSRRDALRKTRNGRPR